jgi:hypothetical protein
MDIGPKAGLDEIALKSESALIIGAGATDFLNGIPLMNYLRRLGVKKIYLGNLACQWWKRKNYETFGPEFYSIRHLKNVELLHETVAVVSGDSRVKTNIYEGIPPEAKISKIFDVPCLIISAQKGVVGVLNGLRKIKEKLNIDLIIDVDSGSDSLYDGKTGVVQTPLHDLLLLSAVAQMDVPSFLALSNYGMDGELSIEELDSIVANVMKQGGFLGAYGLTQKDVLDLEKAHSVAPDPINPLIIAAAKGDHRTYRVLGSRIVKPNPLAAVILIFDLKVVADMGVAKKLSSTSSIREAEKILLKMGIFPESGYRNFVRIIKKGFEQNIKTEFI